MTQSQLSFISFIKYGTYCKVAPIVKLYVPVHKLLMHDSTAIDVDVVPGVQLFVCLDVIVLPVPFQLSWSSWGYVQSYKYVPNKYNKYEAYDLAKEMLFLWNLAPWSNSPIYTDMSNSAQTKLFYAPSSTV